MNDLDALLRRALHDEATEISMTTDMHEAEQKLDQKYRQADRRRRVLYTVGGLAAAAVLAALVVGGLRLGTNQTAPPVTQPTVPSGVAFTSENITPTVKATLPGWTAATDVVNEKAPTRQQFKQATECTGLCPDGQDRGLYFFTAKQAYPANVATLVQDPTYDQYVALWRSLPQGTAVVSGVTTTTIGGRPATVMDVRFVKQVFGLVPCVTPYDAAKDCNTINAGRSWRLAIVDQGPGNAPTLMNEAWNTDNPQAAEFAAEFDSWSATVTFVQASASPSGSASTAPATPYLTTGFGTDVTLALPAWAQDPNALTQSYDGSRVFECKATACASWRELTLFSVDQTYLSETGPITVGPTYRQYVDAWTSLPASLGAVSAVKTTTVGGRPATTMVVRFASQFSALVPCPSATSSRNDCGSFSPPELDRIAIVDQGAGKAPTLLLEGYNAGDANAAAYDKEFATWLKTVTFP